MLVKVRRRVPNEPPHDNEERQQDEDDEQPELDGPMVLHSDPADALSRAAIAALRARTAGKPVDPQVTHVRGREASGAPMREAPDFQ